MVSGCQTDCVPAASPSLWVDTVRSCAGCESGRASGKPGWTESATAQSHTTETPEQRVQGFVYRYMKTSDKLKSNDTNADMITIIDKYDQCTFKMFLKYDLQ